MRDTLLRWLNEPLVHFLVFGAVLFAIFNWRGTGAGSGRVVITPGQIDAMSAAFARTWQRPPTDVELKGQIDEYVREEIATREAMAMGLDRDDTVIRRRLRQKFEFLAEDTQESPPATDADLQAWLDAHARDFRLEPVAAFEQILVDGHAVLLPADLPLTPQSEIAKQFGDEFAAAVMTLAPGTWHGAVRSAYGVHRVFVRERIDGRAPALSDVRPDVEREFIAERRRIQMDATYQRLLARYRVIVERRKP